MEIDAELVQELSLKPLSPVIGIWVDDSIRKFLKDHQISWDDIFYRISFQDNGVQFRYINLNDPNNENLVADSFQAFKNMLDSTSKFFESSDYVSKFALSSTSPILPFPHYNLDDFQASSPWYDATRQIFSISPISESFQPWDVPLFLLAFTPSGSSHQSLISKLPEFMKQSLKMTGIGENIDSSITETEGILINTTQGTLTISKGIKVDLKSPKVQDLLDEAFLKIISPIIETKIPQFYNSYLPRFVEQITTMTKSHKKFALVSKKKKQQNNIVNTLHLRLAHLYLATGNLDQAIKSIPKGEDFSTNLFSYYINLSSLGRAVQTENHHTFSELFQRYSSLLLSSQCSEFEAISILLHTISVCLHVPLTHKVYQFILNILFVLSPFPLFKVKVHVVLKDNPFIPHRESSNESSSQIIAICLEKIAGVILAEGKSKRACYFLNNAMRLYINPGNSLRCASMLHALILSHSDPRHVFICGQDNVIMLSQVPGKEDGFVLPWTKLVSQSLKKVARYLNDCSQLSFVPLLYLNIFSMEVSLKPIMKFFDGLNRSHDNELLKQIEIPFISIKKNVKIIEYGSADFLLSNYEALNDRQSSKNLFSSHEFSPILDMWNEKTKTITFLGHWASEETERQLVCGEKVTLSLIATQESHQTSQIQDLTLIPDENPENFTAEKLSFNLSESYAAKVSITPLKPGPFTISHISYSFYGVVSVRSPIIPIHFITLDSQPSMIASATNFPEERLPIGKIVPFTMHIENVGSAPMSQIFLVHDANSSLFVDSQSDRKELSSHSKIDYILPKKGEKRMTIIEMPPLGIHEKRDVQCRVCCKGSEIIHCVWFFKAKPPLNWRSYCMRFSIKGTAAESLYISTSYDPRNTMKFIAHTALSMSGNCQKGIIEHAFIKNQCLTVVPDNLECNTKSDKPIALVLDENSKDEVRKDDWREAFVNQQKEVGWILVNSDDDVKQISIRHNEKESPPIEEKLRFAINAPNSYKLGENKFGIIDVELLVRNVSNEVMKNIVIDADLPQSNCKAIWIGKCTSTIEQLETDKEITLPFKLAVFSQGIVDIASFHANCNGKVINLCFHSYFPIL